MLDEPLKELPSASVVIATRHRPGPLSECLASIQRQTLVPTQVIVVDSSDDETTKAACAFAERDALFQLKYVASEIRSAAVQRNLGVKHTKSDAVVFLDDDVVLEPEFLAELLSPFTMDKRNEVGGVGGTISNAIPSPMSCVNKWMLRLVLGVSPEQCAGKVIGPAVQFPHAGGKGEVRQVDWIPSGVCAYRKEIFEQYSFGEAFQGYSFMEDVELSVRVGQQFTLLQATGARLYHKGLGSSSRMDWVPYGESRIINRHHVMVHAMGKRGGRNVARLFCYEILYCTLASLWNGGRGGASRQTLLQLMGALRGAMRILQGKSPHNGMYRAVAGPCGLQAE